MSQLLITLPPPGSASAELAYALISNAGLLTSHGRAAPALLPKAELAALIVPAQALSWHLAALPKLPRSMQGSSSQKQQAMLAGVLEEQLLDDVGHMHLVACPALSEGGKTWVAACQKAWLQDAVKILQAANVPLTSIIPQVFPNQAISLHASGTPESAWLTYSDAQGVITLPLSQAALLPSPWPEGLVPSAEPAVAALAEHALGERVAVMQASQWALQSMQAAKAQGVDLAQGDMAVSSGGRAWQSFMSMLRDMLAAPAWRPARYGLALLLMANVMGLNAWAWKQSTALSDKRAQMNQLLTQSFPNVKVVVDAPLQMQRELATLRQTQGQLSGKDFESIYSRFSEIAGINAVPNAIEYIANEVQIKGGGVSGEQLNALLPRLQYAGLNVRSDARTLIVSHSDAIAQTALGSATPALGAKP
jgi:general secretion pathway protein L